MKRHYFTGKSTRAFVHSSIFLTLPMVQSSVALAIRPPEVVYCLSLVPPEEAFRNGFRADGYDTDLLRYAAGTPIPLLRSAYMTTLDTYEGVLSVARHHLSFSPNLRFYVYAIRPSDNFYSVRFSLHYARYHLPSPEARAQAATFLLEGFRTHEWVALGGILGEQIMSAREVYLDQGELYTGEYTVNWDYLYLPPAMANGPMDMHNASIGVVYVAERRRGVFVWPATIDVMGCQRSSHRLNDPKTDLCAPLTKLTVDELRAKSVGRLIATGTLLDSALGQLPSVPGHDEL
ncbi:hypothetical protein N5W20_03615 [Candidatus Kirkpatrickella diaphorinae]|uniref:Uncharacterized protein n=1 Tax=Candidatus Kirkpatrickella diaphorinae TaxID=2984322 RepID=A0ABY6GKV4_9PROT|nr:hypothetical protein [Candidatus Kirkpatrickella diaphorinae]UYH51954.1 hypothetical protein N5W20_03615 [Candidatus Kirkpatrickella diaphorinae]